jgi:hypothetical protein
VGAAIAALRSHAQDGWASATREKVLPVQAAVTEKQKKQNKLFKHQGPKLRDLVSAGTDDITVEIERPYMISTPSNERARLPFMQAVVCNADAIVIGVLKNESPQFAEDENFIFTEYEVAVEEVVKNTSGASIEPKSSITIARDGGTGQVNGALSMQRLRASNPSQRANAMSYSSDSFQRQGRTWHIRMAAFSWTQAKLRHSGRFQRVNLRT